MTDDPTKWLVRQMIISMEKSLNKIKDPEERKKFEKIINDSKLAHEKCRKNTDDN